MKEGRITPENIQSLRPNEVFIAGTNLSGIHGAGSARTAYERFGLDWGVGYGLCGQTYAIPTKDYGIKTTLDIEDIKKYVDEFIDFASRNADKTFLVTAIGCGLANLTPAQIAPLFKQAIPISNIHLPLSFWQLL